MAKNFVPFTDAEERLARNVAERLRKDRQAALDRFPLIMGLTATFGLVSVLYGFEKMIDRIDWLVNNPWVLLVVGLVTLFVTGAAYKKLN